MTSKICFTCRSRNCSNFFSAQSLDSDEITYLDKLKICIAEDLITHEGMEICGLCVKHLRITYKFKMTVLSSQEILRKSNEVEDIKTKKFCEDIKALIGEIDYGNPRSDSDDEFSKNDDNLSDEATSEDISKTVSALTGKLDKKRLTRKHQLKVKSGEVFKCEHCVAQFSKNWQLRKHLARVHNEFRKFVCTYCGKEFKQSYHLKEHTTSHTGEKNYTCPICDKKFQRLSSQRRHIKSHNAPPGHKTKRTPFLCTICGKSFPFSNGVQRHMRIHLGIKNFECKLCYRKFTQSTHLQVHMRTHTGEKPYICDTCGEKFSLKSCLLKHINNRHYKGKTLIEDIPLYYLPKEFGPSEMKISL